MSIGKKSFAAASTEETFSRMFGTAPSPAPDRSSFQPSIKDGQGMPAPTSAGASVNIMAESKPSADPKTDKAEAGAGDFKPTAQKKTTQTADKKAKNSDDEREELIGKKFYLTKDIVKALKRRAYREDNYNFSSFARAAFEMYLKDDLKAVRAEEAGEE